MDIGGLQQVKARLGEAVLDPALWPSLMEDLCLHIGATGAVLLQSDVRTPDIPHTPSLDDMIAWYFRDGWDRRDERAARAVPLLLAGRPVIADRDIWTPDDLRRSIFFNEYMRPSKCPWFAVVGFRAEDAPWGLSIQRTDRQGLFDQAETAALATLATRLTDVATLSTAIGRASLSNVIDVLGLVAKPAIAIGREGRALDWNAAADRLFDDDFGVSRGRVVTTDLTAKGALDRLAAATWDGVEEAPLPKDPIVVRRRGRAPLLIRVLPVDAVARTAFLGAKALLVIADLAGSTTISERTIAHIFGLSPAESRLAHLLAAGTDLNDAAAQLGLARETVRNQLKSVFGKTGTHRQAELVALLSRLS